MKKKIVSIILAITMAASTISIFAAENDTASENTQIYSSMSNDEKTEFINDNLNSKMQHLSTLVTLSANRAYDKIAEEVKTAISDGVTAVENKEAIYHSGAYSGYTRAAGSLDAADAASDSLGEDITYVSRITSTEENRYADGLEAQRFFIRSANRYDKR